MSLRSNEQNARFHQLITENRYDADMKEGLVLEVSNGRVTSSKELSVIEMAKAIQFLEGTIADKEKESRQKMMAKGINLGRDLGMVRGYGEAQNFDGLNALCMRMYKVEKFYGLSNEQMANVITGLANMKKNRKDESK